MPSSIQNALSHNVRRQKWSEDKGAYDRRGENICDGEWAIVIPRRSSSGRPIASQIVRIDYFHGINNFTGYVMCQDVTADQNEWPSHLLMRFSWDSWLYRRMHFILLKWWTRYPFQKWEKCFSGYHLRFPRIEKGEIWQNILKFLSAPKQWKCRAVQPS